MQSSLKVKKMGELPTKWVTLWPIFDKIEAEYAGTILIKFGHMRKPSILKSHICVFISLTVHLEVVSDLTTEAFIACLRRFTASRGSKVIFGATMAVILLVQIMKSSNWCTSWTWGLLKNPSQTSYLHRWFSGDLFPSVHHTLWLWEAAMKFKEMPEKSHRGGEADFWEAIHCCGADLAWMANLWSLASNDEDLEVLTPGHFLIGQALEAHHRIVNWDLVSNKVMGMNNIIEMHSCNG